VDPTDSCSTLLYCFVPRNAPRAQEPDTHRRLSKGLKPRPLAMNIIKQRLYRWLEKLEDERIPAARLESSMFCYVNMWSREAVHPKKETSEWAVIHSLSVAGFLLWRFP
jgi:hypothetical protein